MNFLAAACCTTGTTRILHFGDYQQYNTDPNEFSVTIEGDQNYYVHPSYTGFPNQNRMVFGEESAKDKNFALCLLHMPMSIEKMAEDAGCVNCVAAACMPQSSPNHGDACWIAGWGQTPSGVMDFSDSLQTAGVNVLSRSYCQEHADENEIQNLKLDEICAGLYDRDGDGYTDSGPDPCQGDHGGPLICVTDGKVTVAGVFQWGSGDFGNGKCAKAGFPGVYTNVYNLRKWINDVKTSITNPMTTSTSTTTTTITTTTTTTTTPTTMTSTSSTIETNNNNNCNCTTYHECTEDGCVFNADLCPILPVEWKGNKFSKIIYRAYDGYSVRLTLPNNSPGIDIRNNPYTGFIIMSRRYCGSELVIAIMNGDVKLIIMDTESVYQVSNNYSGVVV